MARAEEARLSEGEWAVLALVAEDGELRFAGGELRVPVVD